MRGAPRRPDPGNGVRPGCFYYRDRPARCWIEAMARRGRDRNGAPVALVTGGGRGFGRLIAETLAARGFAVALIARTGTEIEAAAATIEASGGVAVALGVDVSDDRAVEAAVAQLRRRIGSVDLLVNNAGITGPAGAAWEGELDAWWRTLDVNLRGTVVCARSVLPDMVARRRGRIVNITSNAGVFRWPGMSAYAVSKAAVVKFTENLAAESRRHGIGVFSLDPGLLPIGFSEAAIAGTGSEADSALARIHAWIRNELAAGRGSDPERAVEFVARLASGRYDALSGRQVSVADDLDTLLERVEEVQRDELYVLALRRLADGAPPAL
jgi:NAD(P)-dependent dehydrogenase (short-subunit alcohol dehydrogenase family)